MPDAQRLFQIQPAQAAFLKFEIECGQPTRVKIALQLLCKTYRQGGRLSPRDIYGVENAVLGALWSGRSDEKVRRWSLSALSQFGRAQSCWTAVTHALSAHHEEPQVVSSSIAALFKLDPIKAFKHLDGKGFDPEILVLSALQTQDQLPGKLTNVSINADLAGSTTLKLALVLVGLNRCPAHLFHPRFDNREMVKALGRHHDPLVSQYSAWATAENPNLSAADLGINLTDIEDHPANVRAYIYRLFAAEKIFSSLSHEILIRGRYDHSVDARMGSAIGLRDTYYEGLHDLVLPWFYEEDDYQVRATLLDHIVRQADKCEIYETHALDIFVAEAKDEVLRNRMQATAAGFPIQLEFRRIIYQEDEGLFAEKRVLNVTNNNHFTNNGNMQGQFSMSGTSTNVGSQTNQAVTTAVQQAKSALAEAKALIESMQLEHSLKTEVIEAIGEASESPTKSVLDRVIKGLKKADETAGALTGLGEKLPGILELLSKAAENLPSF